MLAGPKLQTLLQLVKLASKEELIWINGYISGLISQDEGAAPAPTSSGKAPSGKLTIAYGTETGNSKRLALDFAGKAKKAGINAKLVSLDQYRLNDLPKEEFFLTVISTQGEGEPPAAAKKFYDHIHQNGFKLDKLKYAVLALGDTSYPLYCKAGEDVDTQLDRLGGERIVDLQRCDVDYEEEADTWFDNVLNKLSSGNTSSQQAPSVSVSTPSPAKKSSGKKLYNGTVLTNINLNDRDSAKETYHIEISAEGLEYKPGDSIGILPFNHLPVAEAILSLTGIDREKNIEHRTGNHSVFNLLQKKLNIAYLPERVVKQYSGIVKQEIPETKIGLLDLLKIYPVQDSQQFEEVISILEPITPRLYSISSSPEAHSGEVHLTVAKDFFTVNEEIKYGLCSDYLSLLPVDSEVEFYVHRNTEFRLPAEDKDVIMIGPGTGVAPFRSFLAERDATGASGRNWLFFGEQKFASDFLYQTELQNWVETGVLTKLNVAFSRDQQQKIYVQHKMQRHGAEFFEWLESGAYLYICGKKEPMSYDVEDAMVRIITEFGRRTEEQAKQYLMTLKEQGRYLKDVY
ncbi:MAG TPA: flavodoxin domain-containing protein [Flavitalea sp.]|nr:flavodoxin domain-containing protein [Flavitalea sp.]